MENAADALKMAAAILIFIIAIGASFSLFGTAKQTADSIIGMRDKQSYLDAAQLDNGILYTSSEAIEEGKILGVTTKGDRLVNVSEVISTIYRYSKEKYGVTIVKENGEVLARFDSSTESVMQQYNNIKSSALEEYKKVLETNTVNAYANPKFNTLELLYEIDVEGNDNIKYGAPWYGNDEQVQERISCELSGEKYEYNGQSFKRDQGLFEELKDKKIIEVTNEIDNSDYLKEDIDGDGILDDTDLLQQYQMPTVEIIYIIDN